MKKLLTLAALVALSIALFVGVFSVVHRPLVVGEIQNQLETKLSYARKLTAPKVVIFAGSNGRYSHRCEVFTAVLGRPCVNASIGVGIGLDFLLDQWRPVLRPGDVVYMPLEYSQYRFTAAEMHGGLQNALMVHNHRDALWALDTRRIVAAYGSFDLSFLIHGVVEMALDRHGFRRRSSTESLTPQGDERGHTEAIGRTYAEFLRETLGQVKSDAWSEVPEHADAIDVIDAFLAWAREQGVLVVGGLPTVPEAAPLHPGGVERLQRLYQRHGQRFVVLPNRSRYALVCFFDTLYHLNETCQQAHSARAAEALKAVAAGPLPAP